MESSVTRSQGRPRQGWMVLLLILVLCLRVAVAVPPNPAQIECEEDGGIWITAPVAGGGICVYLMGPDDWWQGDTPSGGPTVYEADHAVESAQLLAVGNPTGSPHDIFAFAVAADSSTVEAVSALHLGWGGAVVSQQDWDRGFDFPNGAGAPPKTANTFNQYFGPGYDRCIVFWAMPHGDGTASPVAPGEILSVFVGLSDVPGAGGLPAATFDGNGAVASLDVTVVVPDIQKKKWYQPPDTTVNGIDIRVDQHQMDRTLADDFLCRSPGYITDVHFWGSWLGDQKGYIYRIHLSIHSDIPATPDSHSRPGELLWERDFNEGQFGEKFYTKAEAEGEWFWDVYDPTKPPIPFADQQIWQYDIIIPQSQAFYQEGTPSDPVVYWLDIKVWTEFGTFGWKTSSKHWNDDAVFAWQDATGIADWRELIYPQEHPYHGESIDMAFAITSKPISQPKQACCLPDGVCVNLTAAQCLEYQGGTPQPAGSLCLGDGNGDGVDDACEDCDNNGIADVIEIANNPGLDVNGNGILDACEEDCNGNGVPDDWDIHVGTSTDNNSNGVPDECECGVIGPITCPSGDQANIMATIAGSKDSFAGAPEPASPDASLLGFITSCSSTGYPLDFDEIPGEAGVPPNSWLGHTFSSLPADIVAATLEIRARASSGLGAGGSWNDHISIVDSISGCTPTWAWSSRFMHLSESGGNWTPGETATFCLDLAALPTVAGPTVSVLSQLATGSLSIMVDDDTGLDYAILTVATCPCKYTYEHEFLAGIDDVFALPTSPASPSTVMTTALPGPWRDFDNAAPNRRFGHTFTGLPSGIVAAQLEMRLRAIYDIPTNDSIALEFNNPSFSWGQSIATVVGSAWTGGSTAVVTLDLDNLPPSSSSVTSVLADLADGDLDVYMQDDTIVDYLKLTVWTCCRKSGLPGDIDHSGTVDLIDLSIVSRNWLKKGPCPGCP